MHILHIFGTLKYNNRNMKLYFTASSAEFKKYEKVYFSIRNYLVKEGHLLTRDWLPETKDRIDKKWPIVPDIKEVYKKCIQAIYDADIVIIEDTVSNFSTGHQITIALREQKPTLVLWHGKKHQHFNNMFINGIESEYLEVATYTDKNYKEIISQFISKHENYKEKNRFHLVLNKNERNYLDWAQFKNNQSRTQIIRNAIKNEMEKDENYNKYLVTKS